MDSSKPSRNTSLAPSSPAKRSGQVGRCQICGKTGGTIFDPEKRPPNRLCYRCASEYGMQDMDDE